MLIVQKYGGTSVGSTDRIQNVADRVIRSTGGGEHQVVVVVSAMSGETDRLIGLAKAITPTPSLREYDVLVSTGEQVTIALLSIALEERGMKAVSYTGAQVSILTDGDHANAKIKTIHPERIRSALGAGKVVVLPGFQGVTEDDGHITTLGRGGSDLTAVAVAAALGADSCEVYTDVDGVYSADPRVVECARKIPRISYEEMLEMASVGAKVMQARSVGFGMRYNVPIHVRSSFNENEGTWIVHEDRSMESIAVSAVAHSKNEAKVALRGIPDQPGVAAQLFERLAAAGVNVDMIIQNISQDERSNMTFTVPKADFERSLATIREVATELGATDVRGDTSIAKVSIVGVGMKSHSGVAATMFRVLAQNGINIQMISTSEIKISVVIDAKYTELAVRSLHSAFGLDSPVEGRGSNG